MFFIIEEAKEIVLEFSKGTAKVLWFYFVSKDININDSILHFKCRIV